MFSRRIKDVGENRDAGVRKWGLGVAKLNTLLLGANIGAVKEMPLRFEEITGVPCNYLNLITQSKTSHS